VQCFVFAVIVVAAASVVYIDDNDENTLYVY